MDFDKMTPEEFFKGVAQAVKGESAGPARVSGGGIGGGIGDPEKFKKGMDKYIASIKATIEPQKVFKDMLSGQKQAIFDATEAIKDLDEQLENSTDAEDKRTLQRAKNEIITKTANQNLRASAINLGMGFASAAGTIISGVAEFAKGLLSNQGGVELATGLAATSARATGEAVSSVGSTISALGGIALMFIKNFGMVGKIFTALAVLAGPIIELLGIKAAQLAEEGIKILGEELVKTRENFKKITGAGALFAGGMTEMRQQAGAAGLTVEDFGNAIKNNTASLSAMGLGMAQASKRMAGITGELRRSDMGKQLQNLGYGMEEFASLSAQTAANLNASGKLRSMSDADVAKATLAYGKDLKILQGITGEDAKKKMEEARTRSMEADLLAQAMAKGGPEAMAKLQNQLATMPESMKKGYMEFVSTGGNAIADSATNVAISQNPKIMEQYRQMFTTLGDGSKDATAALKETGNLTAATAEYARQNAGSMQSIATGARLSGNALLQGATDIANSLILVNQTFTKASVEASATAAEKLAKTADPLTNKVGELETATYNLKVAVEQKVTPLLGSYATHLNSMLGTVNSIVEKINAAMDKMDVEAAEKVKGENETVGEGMGQIIGGSAGMAIGAGMGTVLLPGIGTAVGGAIGGWLGSMAGGKIGGFFGSLFDDKKKVEATPRATTEPLKKFALGGITKERAIFGEQGPEAAVPLPDGRTIPVTLKVDKAAPTGKAAANKSAGEGVSNIADTMFNIAKTISPVIGAVGAIGKSVGSMISEKMSPGINASAKLDSVDTKNQGLFDFMTKSSEDTKTTTASLNDGITRLYTVMENQTTSTANAEKSMQELVGLIRAQLSKHDDMINELRNNVSVNQRILTNSYS
jgi:hypothetical protein